MKKADRPSVERRRVGRPAAPDPSGTLSMWLPIKSYDELCRLAQARKISVSSLTRELLHLQLKNGRADK